MKNQLVYFLRKDKEGFLDRLRNDNSKYNLGYHLIKGKRGDIFIESAMLEGKVTLGVLHDSELIVYRKFNAEHFQELFRRKVTPLIAIADAYPDNVSRKDLNG